MTSTQLSEEEIFECFGQLKNREDISHILDVDDKSLRYLLYKLHENERYVEFTIPKKGVGKFRKISAPIPALKAIQKKLNLILRVVYRKHITKSSTHGFVRGKSIITNGKEHIGKRYVLNLDLKDFFPSINFGRVRGLLMAKPYQCTRDVATIIAKICCYNNQLPQGSPTSPIISNMICAKLDTEFQRLAKKYRCFYTRYADDITISSSVNIMPSQIAKFSDIPGETILGNEVIKIVEQNGFQINEQKVRLRTKNRRQEVTGLIVNEKLNVKREYVRTTRTMLYQLEKNILSGVEIRVKPEVIRGKIEFLGAVRGYEDSIYLKFLNRLNGIAPEILNENQKYRLRSLSVSQVALIEPEIWMEGKTDPKHLKAALRKLQNGGKFKNMSLALKENVPTEREGDGNLLVRLKCMSDSLQQRPSICIFDRDVPKILPEIHDENKGFKFWGNRVYSFALPIPSHRKEAIGVCIEHYYTDHEIKTKDNNGRQLFIFKDFNSKTLRHLTETNLSIPKAKNSPDAIIDSSVYNNFSESVALSKDDFASYIVEEVDDFSNFDFSEFSKIFGIIQKILFHDHDHIRKA